MLCSMDNDTGILKKRDTDTVGDMAKISKHINNIYFIPVET